MKKEITELFEHIYEQHEDVTAAAVDFKEYLSTNPDVKVQYNEWCEEMGYSTRKGFKEYFNNRESETPVIWDSMICNKDEYDGIEFSFQ